MSVQSLDIISVNLWQILISLANLLIITFVLKRFLFKRVQAVLTARQEQVSKIYGEAEESRNAAVSMKQEYEARLASAPRGSGRGGAHGCRDGPAQGRSEFSPKRPVRPADSSRRPKRKSPWSARQMLTGVRKEISDLAVGIASKVVEREIQPKDHEAFVDEFIRNVGDEA